MLEMQKKKDFVIKSLYYGLVFSMFYVGFKFLLPFLFPFFVSFILVYFLRRPSYLISKKMHIHQNKVCIILVLLFYLTVFLLLILITNIFLRQLSKEVVMQRAIDFATNCLQKIGFLFDKLKNYFPVDPGEILKNLPQKIGDSITVFVPKVLSNIVSALPRILFSTVVTIVSSCYFANEYKPLKNFFMSVLPQGKQELVRNVKIIVNKKIVQIIKGYSIISLIIFLICFTGLLVMKIESAFILAVIITVVDLLPVVGVGTILLPWVAIELLGGNILLAVGLLIIHILCVLAHHITEPKFVGKRVGIPPFISLLFMFVSLKLFGFLGMLISLLLLVVVVDLYKKAE